jgi:hypothetical protein
MTFRTLFAPSRLARVCASCAPVSARFQRFQAGSSGLTRCGSSDAETRLLERFRLNGAAQESNLPSVGLPRLTGFEALLRNVHLRTEAGFGPASVLLRAGRFAEISTNSSTKFRLASFPSRLRPLGKSARNRSRALSRPASGSNPACGQSTEAKWSAIRILDASLGSGLGAITQIDGVVALPVVRELSDPCMREPSRLEHPLETVERMDARGPDAACQGTMSGRYRLILATSSRQFGTIATDGTVVDSGRRPGPSAGPAAAPDARR